MGAGGLKAGVVDPGMPRGDKASGIDQEDMTIQESTCNGGIVQ